jgi:formylglycine-generating enzyme required for sulfatase activity
LVVEPEYQYTKAFNLSPEQSRLEVYSSPTGANVWLNNQIQAQKTPARFALLPGVYTVSVHITGHIASEEVVTLGPDSTRKLDLKLVEGNVPPGMVLVPAGEFQFGVDNQAPDERPKRTVYLDVFYIDKYEATNADFKAVFKEHRFPAGQENFAVTKVSWEQASAYALAVKKRLPTEMEWEKATRGTDGREYPWGGLFDPEMANTGATPGAKIREVGQYRAGASPYNCMDMAGNAYEWTASWYAAYPGNRVVVKEYGQLYRVLRGGSFQGSPYEARCAARRYDLPDRARSDYGFRCALSAESGEGQGGRSQ